MNRPDPPHIQRPSHWWTALAVLCLAVASTLAVIGALAQRRSTQPVGEGVVFTTDAKTAEALLAEESDLALGVRVARNHLDIESVSVVDDTGTVVASTSEPAVDTKVANDLLLFGATSNRFTALASAIGEDLWLDGVVAWPSGSILYQVISPLDGMSGSLLLHYDISSLLARRTRPGQLQPETLQIFGLALAFLGLGAVVVLGRGRAKRRYQSLVRESDLLRDYSRQLEAVNSDLERARNAAEEALALAEEKIRIRSEFVLMINHELRTPLTSVVTGAEVIKSAALTDTEREALLDSMVNDGRRLLEIIDQILAVARIENRGVSKELVAVPLQELWDEVVGAPGELPGTAADVMVKTDAKALKLVIGSLVDNALTHGAKEAKVRCSTNPLISAAHEVGIRPDHAVFIAVTDDGPGIPSEFLPRVFEKFEKSSFSSGTGLGLYVVRMVVEALQGSVAVSSSRDGTSFQVALPTEPAMEPIGVPA